ncbi:MAG TPA: Tad domain-containing protein [Polyangiaceae bacterium]|nr:Tad domain-containing protein [Polyangiaceae bacterium]
MKAFFRNSTVPLRADNRGAIMVITVFMAVFLVAILYYAMGIGQAILLRERMQDASDAGALSGAIMHARGMNFLVLINIVMAALLAVLVALKAVEGLAILGIAVALALAWITGGSSAALIPPLNGLRQSMNSAYDSVRPPVFQALEILHQTADTVKGLVPDAAEGIVKAERGEHGLPDAQELLLRPQQELPVEDDGFDTLCGKAGSLAGGVVTKPLNPLIGGLGIDEAIGSFTKSLSSWFCGDSGDPPPVAKKPRVETVYPQTDAARACASDNTAVSSHDPGATTPACDRSEREATDAKPDAATGQCAAGVDCGGAGAYEIRAAIAIGQCDPDGAPSPKDYTYQSRAGTASYVWTRMGWKQLERFYQTPVLVVKAAAPPCGRKERRPTVAIGYNQNVHPRGDVNEILPVCSNEVGASWPSDPPGTSDRVQVQLGDATRDAGWPQGPSLGDKIQVRFAEVVHILGCTKVEEKTGSPPNVTNAKSDSGGSSKSPKMVLGAATLGDANFQLRVIVQGEPPRGRAEGIVRLAVWNAAAPADDLEAERSLGRLSVAQSEYFYDGDEGRGEWMWQMKWRARLTPFRIPSEDSAMAHCNGPCRDAIGQLQKYGPLFAH